ncbi:MAG TPA: hypothetical protein VMB75_01985 [Rhodocyclaceae bacterium]|nr:hypothetical protein [Rhodocyclaceae bacterium]
MFGQFQPVAVTFAITAIEDGENERAGSSRELMERRVDHLNEPDRQADDLEAEVQRWQRENTASQEG